MKIQPLDHISEVDLFLERFDDAAYATASNRQLRVRCDELQAAFDAQKNRTIEAERSRAVAVGMFLVTLAVLAFTIGVATVGYEATRVEILAHPVILSGGLAMVFCWLLARSDRRGR